MSVSNRLYRHASGAFIRHASGVFGPPPSGPGFYFSRNIGATGSLVKLNGQGAVAWQYFFPAHINNFCVVKAGVYVSLGDGFMYNPQYGFYLISHAGQLITSATPSLNIPDDENFTYPDQRCRGILWANELGDVWCQTRMNKIYRVNGGSYDAGNWDVRMNASFEVQLFKASVYTYGLKQFPDTPGKINLAQPDGFRQTYVAAGPAQRAGLTYVVDRDFNYVSSITLGRIDFSEFYNFAPMLSSTVQLVNHYQQVGYPYSSDIKNASFTNTFQVYKAHRSRPCLVGDGVLCCYSGFGDGPATFRLISGNYTLIWEKKPSEIFPDIAADLRPSLPQEFAQGCWNDWKGGLYFCGWYYSKNGTQVRFVGKTDTSLNVKYYTSTLTEPLIHLGMEPAMCSIEVGGGGFNDARLFPW